MNHPMTQDFLQERLRHIPAVDQMLQRPCAARWIERTSRAFVVSEIQKLLQETRQALRLGSSFPDSTIDPEALDASLDERFAARLCPALRPVINATGVILHTNLGRAPLSAAARDSLVAVSAHYTNLEYDIGSGERSHRDRLLEPLVSEILGCEASIVVNNNAAAVFLIFNTLAKGREVIVSRGELIEIGGSFRLPDILACSDAVLHEVGTTNKTRIQDYESAINSSTALLFRAHPSNYRIRGFTQRPKLEELVALSHSRQLPLVEDIGSGCLIDLAAYGLRDEPIAQDSLKAGVDIVSFSGDKLLGGPQAGIIAGAGRLVSSIRRNPLIRICRVEKLIYGALEATLQSYRMGNAHKHIPVLRMIATNAPEILARARRFAGKLKPKAPAGVTVSLIRSESVVGGGSFPDSGLPTTLLAIESVRLKPNEIEKRLRMQDPPIVARLDENRTLIDLRTVFPDQDRDLLQGLLKALA